jgi:hypothetical protein
MKLDIFAHAATIVLVAGVTALAMAMAVGGVAFVIADGGKRSWHTFARATLVYFAYGLPVAVLSYLSGFISGISRVAIMGTVLPAIFSLAAGVNIYVFGSDNKHRVVIGYCIVLFALSIFIGLEQGAWERERGRENRMIYLSDQEARIRHYRSNRDLPADFPAWMMGGEAK